MKFQVGHPAIYGIPLFGSEYEKTKSKCRDAIKLNGATRFVKLFKLYYKSM